MLIKYFKYIIIIIAFILLFNSFTFKLNKDVVEGFSVYDFIDTRVFYLDENQKGRDLRDLLKNLDKTNCIGWKISGFPYLRTHHKLVPYFNSDKILAQYIDKMDKKYKHQMYPFITCIENSKKGFAHVKSINEGYPNLWRGIGPIYLKNNSVYEDAELQRYIPGFKNRKDRLKDLKTSLISNRLDEFVDEGEGPRNYNHIMDLDETYFLAISQYAKQQKLIINLDYYFDNIHDDTPDVLKGILSDSDEIDSNYKLYEGDYKLFRYLKANSDSKIILHTNVFKKRTFKVNNSLKNLSMIEYYDLLLRNFPNVVIELSGNSLLNCFITESKSVEKIDNNLSAEERKNKLSTGLSQVRDYSDLSRTVLKPLDDLLSGKPLTQAEKDQPIRKSTPTITREPDSLRDNLFSGNFKEADRKTGLSKLAKAFAGDDPKKPSEETNAEDEIKMAALDNKLKEEVLQKFDDIELEKAKKGTFEPVLKPNTEYDTDGNTVKPECKFFVPPLLLENKDFVKNLYCTPIFNSLDFAKLKVGSPLTGSLKEVTKPSPSIIKLKKNKKKLSKMKNKEPQLTKFIKIETFENYNVKEMFGNLDDKGFEFARKGKNTAKGYAEHSVKLPNNTPPPNNTPVSDSEARNTSMKSIQKGVKSNDLQSLVSNVKDYGKDGEKVVDDVSEAAKTIKDNLVNEMNNKSILERPKDLYNLGFTQYFDPKTRKRYYYMYGPPEYEYVDSNYVVYKKKRRLIPSSGDDIYDKNGKLDVDKLDKQIERKGINYYGIKEMIESGNYDDLPNKNEVINYLKTKKKSKQTELESDDLYREIQETEDEDKKQKLNEKRQTNINKNLSDAVSSPSDNNIQTNITIHKYTHHDAAIKKEWIKLLEKYSNNFILGTGVKIDFDYYPSNCVLVNRVLSELDEDKAIKISRNNFLHMLKH